jgi:hypothetical protein
VTQDGSAFRPAATRSFSARIRQAGIHPFVPVPAAVSRSLGGRGMIPVRGRLNGVAIRGTLVPVGGGRHRFYVNGFMRKAAGVDVGDAVRLEVGLDRAPRAGLVPVQAVGLAPPTRRARVDVDRPLWTCPRCGHRFVTRNLWHSCARYPLSHHFKGKNPVVRRLFTRFRALVQACGPVEVYAQKTRIVMQARVRFGGCTTAREWLDAGLWLGRRVAHPRLRQVSQPVPGCYVHAFRFRDPVEMDAAFGRLVREAYAIGRREHLRR